MRVLILTNPKAGTGRGIAEAVRLSDRLRAEGASVNVLEVGAASAKVLESPAMQRADALVVIGGDGTLHRSADLAIVTGLALYHYPMGNENLFAREFGHKADPGAVIAAVRGGEVRRVDAGRANGTTFTIMASVGLDASIVHRVARGRKKAIGHRSYVLPGIAETLRPTLPELFVEVDGETLVDGVRGLVVVANSARYGLDLDPAKHASVMDGRLDVVVYPARTSVGVARWLWKSRKGKHLDGGAVPYATGRRIVIRTAGGPAPVQLDGEAPGVTAGDRWPPSEKGRTPLEAEIMPGVLPVLMPGPA